MVDLGSDRQPHKNPTGSVTPTAIQAAHHFYWHPRPEGDATQFTVAIALPPQPKPLAELQLADRLSLVGKLHLANGEEVIVTAHDLTDVGLPGKTRTVARPTDEVIERLRSVPPDRLRVFGWIGPDPLGYCTIIDSGAEVKG